MLALVFQGKGQCQKAFFRISGSGDDVRHFRLSGGDGAGLVQCDDLNLSGALQGFARFEEDSVFGAQPVADHNGHRRRQPQRAGAGDHQNGDGAGQ